MKNLLNDPVKKIFWLTFIFLLLLWLSNISQYLVVFSFLIYIFILCLYLKNINLGLILGSITAFCVQTGKTYEILMLDPGMVSEERFPFGYSLNFSITINHIIGLLLTGFIINGLVFKKYSNIKIIFLDILVFGLFFWSYLSSIFGSNMPEISIVLSILSLPTLIKYVFFRLNLQVLIKRKNFIFAVITALVLFESVVSIVQFAHGSPTAKSVESQKHLEIFGAGAIDEIDFVFRPLGTFSHANYLAAFMVLAAPLVLVTVYKQQKYFNLTIFLLAMVSIGLTLSRSGWLALMPQFLILFPFLIKNAKLFFLKMNKFLKILLIIFMLTVFAIIIFPRIAKSINIDSTDINNGLGIRLAQFENAVKLILLHPLFGVGEGMNVIEGYNLEPNGVMWSFPSVVHNIFLLVMVENGLPYFILYIAIFIYITYQLLKLLKNIQEKPIIKALLSGIIGVIIVGMIHPYNFLELVLLLTLIYVK